MGLKRHCEQVNNVLESSGWATRSIGVAWQDLSVNVETYDSSMRTCLTHCRDADDGMATMASTFRNLWCVWQTAFRKASVLIGTKSEL